MEPVQTQFRRNYQPETDVVEKNAALKPDEVALTRRKLDAKQRLAEKLAGENIADELLTEDLKHEL